MAPLLPLTQYHAGTLQPAPFNGIGGSAGSPISEDPMAEIARIDGLRAKLEDAGIDVPPFPACLVDPLGNMMA